MGWNVVKQVYQEFLKKHNINVFENFEYPHGINPLLFSQLCIFYYADVVPVILNEIQEEGGQVYTEKRTKNKGKIV